VWIEPTHRATGSRSDADTDVSKKWADSAGWHGPKNRAGKRRGRRSIAIFEGRPPLWPIATMAPTPLGSRDPYGLDAPPTVRSAGMVTVETSDAIGS